MPPTYPHPQPDRDLPFNLDVADPARVDKLPDPLKLTAHVREWLSAVAPGVTGRSLVDLAQSGSILVLGNAAVLKSPDVQEPDRISAITHRPQKGRLIKGALHGAAADILNGQVSNQHVKSRFDAYKQENAAAQAGLPAPLPKDPTKLVVAGDDSLLTYAKPRGAGGSASAQWDYHNRRILVNAHVEDGSMIVHEYFHTFDVDGEGANTFGWYMDEGFTDFFARDVAARFRYPYKGNWGYENGYRAVKVIVDAIGLDKVCQLYFERSPEILALVRAPSQAIAKLAKGMDAGTLDAGAPNVRAQIDAFIGAARSWNGWLRPQHWEVPVPTKPFRSGG